jgi:hypothetical protein
MANRNFDILVIGMDLGGLIAAALLVKRGKSVLVADLSGGRILFDPAHVSLSPSPNLLAGLSGDGLLANVLQELDTPLVKRREFVPADPPFQVLLPGHRIDLERDVPLLDRLAVEFGNAQANAIAARLEAADSATRRVHAALREPGLFPAPGFLGRPRPSLPLKRLAEQIATDEQAPFSAATADLSPEARAFLVGSVSFLSRFADDLPVFLALYHLGLTRGGLFHAAGGVRALTDLCKERVATYRGSFCQTDAIESLAWRRKPRVHVRFQGLPDDYFGDAVVWNTDPRILAPHVPKRVFRSIVKPPAAEGGPVPGIATVKVRLRNGGLPVGLLRDCLLVPDPSRPPAGLNLLALSVPPPKDGAVTCEIEASYRVDDLTALTAARLAGDARAVVQALHDPIPFLDEFLMDAAPTDPAAIAAGSYERAIQGSRLPLGLGRASLRSSDPTLFYSGREALPGVGMIGEVAVGTACADILSLRY